MKSLAAVASALLQLPYVIALIEVITISIKTVQIISLHGAGDPKMIAGLVSQSLIDLILAAAIGLIGVLIAWRVLINRNDRPAWFPPVSTFFAWTWMVFIPIGTVIGISMLRWRRSAKDTPVNDPA